MSVKHSEVPDESEKNIPAPEVKKEEQMIPLSEVEALISKRLKEAPQGTFSAELIDSLVKLASNSAENQKTNFKFDPTQYREPDPKDLLKEPVVFWAQGFHYVIGDDKRGGVPVPSPLGVIQFKANSTEKRQTGKDINIICFAKHVCQSKKELEFLENHSMLGIRFFKKASSLTSVDVRYTELLVRLAGGLKSVSAHQIMEQAKSAGIDMFSTDINDIRLSLAQHYAKLEMPKIEAASLLRVADARKEELLLKKQ